MNFLGDFLCFELYNDVDIFVIIKVQCRDISKIPWLNWARMYLDTVVVKCERHSCRVGKLHVMYKTSVLEALHDKFLWGYAASRRRPIFSQEQQNNTDLQSLTTPMIAFYVSAPLGTSWWCGCFVIEKCNKVRVAMGARRIFHVLWILWWCFYFLNIKKVQHRDCSIICTWIFNLLSPGASNKN